MTGSGKGSRQRTRFRFILTLNITFIYTDALYELLSQTVSEESGGRDSDPVSSQLSSVACACLLSLVVGPGDTSKMLSAIYMMLIRSSRLSSTMQVCTLLICLSVCICTCVLKYLCLPVCVSVCYICDCVFTWFM